MFGTCCAARSYNRSDGRRHVEQPDPVLKYDKKNLQMMMVRVVAPHNEHSGGFNGQNSIIMGKEVPGRGADVIPMFYQQGPTLTHL